VDRGWNEHVTAKWLDSRASSIRTGIQIQQNNSLKVHLITYALWFILIFLIIICLSSLIERSSEET
jgi:hypothetical protein